MGKQGVPHRLTENDICDALRKHTGCVQDAAKELGYSRWTIYRLIKAHWPNLLDVIEEERLNWDMALVESAERCILKCIDMGYTEEQLGLAKLALDAAKHSLNFKGGLRKWGVVADQKKSECAMVDKMKSMEVVE